MGTLPAAAIPVGAKVRLPDQSIMKVTHVENAVDDKPGRVRWHGDNDLEIVIGASIPVDVLSLP